MIDREQLVTNDNHRPYAAAANVVGVIERIRRINLPEAIDPEFLDVARITGASRGRVLDALRFLGLIHPNGEPTDALEAIAAATDEEWRELLAARIRDAYGADLSRIDPAQDTQATIISQFRRYQPRSQSERMVMLFLGLCRAAGMPVLEAPRQRAMRANGLPGRQVGGRQVRLRGSTGTTRTRRSAELDADSGNSLVFDLAQLDLIEDEAEYKKAWDAIGQARRIIGRARLARSEPSPVSPNAEGE
jgi:hypothetical protein